MRDGWRRENGGPGMLDEDIEVVGRDLLEESSRLEGWDAARLEGKGRERWPRTNPSCDVATIYMSLGWIRQS